MDRPVFTDLDLAVLRVAELAREAELIERAQRRPLPARAKFLERLAAFLLPLF